MKGDLTRGSVFKQILFFSIPFLIGNLFQLLYSIVDMVVVGQFVGPEAYAAVGAASGISYLPVSAFQGLTLGFSTVCANYFGANEKDGVKRSFAHSIKLTLIIAAAFTVLMIVFARPILHLMKTPSDIFERTHTYVVSLYAGLIISAVFNLLSNMIRALGDSRTPLYFLIAACLINIALDVLFVAVFDLDVIGVGLATVTAQLASVIMCVVYIKKKQRLLHVEKGHFAHNGELTARLLRIGVPMAFLNIVISIGGLVVQIATNGFGTNFISAQTSGAKVENFVNLPLLSFGSALSVFVAQNNGARRYDRVSSGIWKTTLMGLVWWIVALLLLVPFGDSVVRLLTGSEMPGEVIENAHRYIITNCAFSVILVFLINIKSALQALERGFFPMISGILEIFGRAGVAFTVMYLVSKGIVEHQGGFNILCFSNPVAWIFSTLTVLPDFIISLVRLRRKKREQRNIKEINL